MLERRELVRSLLEDRGEMLVVAGLGSPVYDVAAAGDHPLNFYTWGAMGSAAMIGLGLALARPDRPVAVFTGDGEMLMGMGAFATIAQHRPPNLAVVVLDNGQYAETGMQTTATGHGTDLAAVARGCGLGGAYTFASEDGIEPLRREIHARRETSVVVAKIASGDVPRTLPLKDGVEIKSRFLSALAA